MKIPLLVFFLLGALSVSVPAGAQNLGSLSTYPMQACTAPEKPHNFCHVTVVAPNQAVADNLIEKFFASRLDCQEMGVRRLLKRTNTFVVYTTIGFCTPPRPQLPSI